MLLSNRAIFNRSGLGYGAPTWNEEFRTSTTFNEFTNYGPWTSLDLNSNTISGAEFTGGWQYRRDLPGQSAGQYTRVGNNCQFSYSKTMYLSTAWNNDVLSLWNTYNTSLNYYPQAVNLYQHFYVDTGLINFGINPNADLNGTGIGGMLHIGRTQSEPGFSYDGFFVIDMIDPVTGGAIKFKIPFNRSEVLDRWCTITFAISNNSSDFDGWAGWEPDGSSSSTHFCRFYLTNSSGTVTMDANNKHFYNNGIDFDTTPWNGTASNGFAVGHYIIVGDPQWLTKFSNITPLPNYLNDPASWCNLWVAEGKFLDPKLNWDVFTNQGRPMLPGLTVNGVTADIYIPIQSQSEVTYDAVSDFHFLDDRASSINWVSETSTTSAGGSALFGQPPYPAQV